MRPCAPDTRSDLINDLISDAINSNSQGGEDLENRENEHIEFKKTTGELKEGNIFECINEAVKYVTNNIRWRAEIVGLERVETPEVPVEAFREIIVNSFAHMKVSKSSSNEIYLTPSKIHIYNPGPLVPGTDPKMFASGEQGSMIRNPLIAMVLYYNRTIDAFGTGFERVFSCRSRLLPLRQIRIHLRPAITVIWSSESD